MNFWTYLNYLIKINICITLENKEIAQQKKAWVTPEIHNETVEETEGKAYTNGIELNPSYGPS